MIPDPARRVCVAAGHAEDACPRASPPSPPFLAHSRSQPPRRFHSTLPRVCRRVALSSHQLQVGCWVGVQANVWRVFQHLRLVHRRHRRALGPRAPPREPFRWRSIRVRPAVARLKQRVKDVSVATQQRDGPRPAPRTSRTRFTTGFATAAGRIHQRQLHSSPSASLCSRHRRCRDTCRPRPGCDGGRSTAGGACERGCARRARG
eukprot:3289973-Rhodomonas_salina.1